MNFSKHAKLVYMLEIRIVFTCGEGAADWLGMREPPPRVLEMIWVVVTGVYTNVKIHRAVHSRSQRLAICKLNFSKTD